MRGDRFFTGRLSAETVRKAAKNTQKKARLQIKRLDEILIFLDFIISSGFAETFPGEPLGFAKSESPDFIVRAGKKKIGVELTRAKTRRGGGAEEGEEPADFWRRKICERLDAKLKKYRKGTIRPFKQNYLVVLDETGVRARDNSLSFLIGKLLGDLNAAKYPCPPSFCLCLKTHGKWFKFVHCKKAGDWITEGFSASDAQKDATPQAPAEPAKPADAPDADASS